MYCKLEQKQSKNKRMKKKENTLRQTRLGQTTRKQSKEEKMRKKRKKN
jgi:hypothetical protein